MTEALAVDAGTVPVAYASRHGSTREIAETIASQLASEGLCAIAPTSGARSREATRRTVSSLRDPFAEEFFG